MTGSDLFREIGSIKEEYIVEAEQYKRKARILGLPQSPAFRKTMTAAACLVVCVGLAALVQKSGFTMSDANESVREETAVMPPAAESSEASLSMETLEEAKDMATGYGDTEAVKEAPANVEGVVEETPQTYGEKGAESAEAESAGKSGDIQEAQSELQIEENSKTIWDAEDIRSRQAEYSNDYEELIKVEDALVMVHGKAEAGSDLWEEFLAKVEDGKTAQIHIIQFTIEGDAIIETVYYDGSIFRLYKDSSRDAFGSSENAYYEASFKYLQKKEENMENGSRYIRYCLTDNENSTSDKTDLGKNFEILYLYE